MFTCLFDVVGYAFAQIYVFMHFFPCFMLRSTFVHVYMLGFTFYHVYVLNFYMFTCMFLCLHLDLCFCMFVCLDLCSLYALCYFLCACVLYAMFVCLGLDLVCHAMCYCSPFAVLSFFLVLWPSVSLDRVEMIL